MIKIRIRNVHFVGSNPELDPLGKGKDKKFQNNLYIKTIVNKKGFCPLLFHKLLSKPMAGSESKLLSTVLKVLELANLFVTGRISAGVPSTWHYMYFKTFLHIKNVSI